MSALADFVMPSLGADMDEGTVTEWRVGVGDRVERGDIVATVETDKADIDVEVWQSGTVAEILVEPGRTVVVGTPLARLDVGDAEGGDAGGGDGEVPRSTEVPTPPPAPVATPTPEPVAPVVERIPGPVGVPALAAPPVDLVPASPLARRLAAERGVELSTLVGSGPGGSVVARDLEAAPAGSTPAPATAIQPQPADERRRRAIAELMARSKREIPHYYLGTELDVEAALAWMEATNAERPVEDRLLPAALLMRVTALALVDNPGLNGFWIDGRFVPGDGVNLGMAVSLRGGGLVAPAIHGADELGLDELMARLKDLVTRARTGRLRGSEMTGATATVTNLGDRGVEVVYGVIHPPQVALVGLGRIDSRPAVDGDRVVARRQVTATLSADHRASDGQRGARFLNTMARLLDRPEDLA